MSNIKPTTDDKRLRVERVILQGIPLLAPIPTAWLVGTACYDVMGFPFLVALPAALVVEGLGFVSINLANRMREFNRHLNAVEQKQQMRAPVAQAWMLSGLYVVVVLVMTVLLHIIPQLSVYAPIPFIFMAVAGGWLYALSSDQGEREAKWSDARASLTANRKRRSATLSDAASDVERPSATLKSRSAKRPATLEAKIYRCECGYQSTDRFEVSGHKGKCATHQEIKRGQPIPVDLQITQEAKR